MEAFQSLTVRFHSLSEFAESASRPPVQFQLEARVVLSEFLVFVDFLFSLADSLPNQSKMVSSRFNDDFCLFSFACASEKIDFTWFDLVLPGSNGFSFETQSGLSSSNRSNADAILGTPSNQRTLFQSDCVLIKV